MVDLSRLCIHQVTIMEQCDFRQSVECFARHGVGMTAVWRDKLDAVGTKTAARILDDNGVAAAALCPGGLMIERAPAAFDAAIDANRRWLDQAAAIGAKCLVVITGGLPEGEVDLGFARERALEGLTRLLDNARAAGVRLALEPLHPMVCGYRSVISTLREANDWLDLLDAGDTLGIAVDSYALWWEPGLQEEIARAGRRIAAYHVSDWLPDTCDVRLDRGMPGDGVIDLPQIRSWLEATGFNGPIEVEIFSARTWWKEDPDHVVETITARFEDAF